MDYVKSSDDADGTQSSCWTGTKVLCRAKPAPKVNPGQEIVRPAGALGKLHQGIHDGVPGDNNFRRRNVFLDQAFPGQGRGSKMDFRQNGR